MAALTSTERSRLRRARLAASTAAPDLLFVREDWQLYLDPTRLPQKAGCTKWRLRALVLKEIADNALDHGGKVTVERIDPDTWAIGDDGPGLDAERIVRLFAPNRPLTSSKLLRRPSRGAVGNGLRVVSGAVVASGGRLWVESRGHRYEVKIDRRTGTASVVELSQCNGPGRQGTLVTIRFGAAIPRGDDDDCLALDALRFPGRACEPFRSDARWYDADAWHELIEATPSGTTVGELLAHMGIASTDRRPVARVKFAELGTLVLPPEPVLLPRGNGGLDGYSYAKESVTRALIEAWAKATERCPPSKGRGDLRVYINRTPPPIRSRIDNEGWAWLGSNEIVCKVEFNGGALYDVELSITAPFVPITNDSKAPDLKRWNEAIGRVLAQAMRKAHAALAPTGRKRGDIKDAAYAVMEAAYLKASGDGEYPANARQVMYAARPMIAEILGPDRPPVDDKRFTQEFLPDFMRENEKLCADWDVVYDARGHLIEPHTGTVTPIGTLDVRGYLHPRVHGPATLLGIAAGNALDRDAQPTDRYRTVLFIEKEGFEPLLDRARIRERFDCAILSTKGTSAVAARLCSTASAGTACGSWSRTISTGLASASPTRSPPMAAATSSSTRQRRRISGYALRTWKRWTCRTNRRPTPDPERLC